MSPTQRTLKSLREQGRLADICERRLPGRPGMPFGKTLDLFGFIDIISIDPTDGIIAVQSCGQDYSGHMKKIMEGIEARDETYDNAVSWLRHAKLELWGWRKVKLKRGGKAMRWRPRIADFDLDPEGNITATERKG